MSRFCITPEGKIYIFNPDNGSTTPLGKIDAQGRFSWPDGEVAVRKSELERKLREEMRKEVEKGKVAECKDLETMSSDDVRNKFVSNPKSVTGSKTGHQWVDLGLPSGLKWATCNIGATMPEECGDYFSWGEIKPKETYDITNYKHGSWRNRNFDDTFYGYRYVTKRGYGRVDSKRTLSIADNGATENWGGKWRMPSPVEFKELIDNCDWQWVRCSEFAGSVFTSNINGAAVFFPAAGFRARSAHRRTGVCGLYWSSEVVANMPKCAICFDLDASERTLGVMGRHMGLPIRPVCK